ncbi:YbaB/EbfC family nucleoid-associated protein [Nonomuraea bangladeshensis]|uniref:YbaB/EbfC family nucleoid-associated protein n=1 Tax=Nonomuraea bangladeshensis TaxID=404385 RepID=UPI0031D08A94
MPSSGPWNDDLDHLERVLRETEEIMRDLGAARAEIAQITSVGEAGGGMVRVVAGGGGRLRAIKLDPRVMRQPADELARQVMAATRAAQEAAGRRSHEIVERARARAESLPEPLDETFVRRRIEQVADEIDRPPRG